MTTLQQLTTPLTPDEVKAAIYSGLASSGVVTTTWKPGAVTRTLIAVFAVVIAACSQLVAAIARGGFLELAEADWLDLVGVHVFGVAREEGSFATGEVTLTNTAGGAFIDVQPGELIVKTAAGKTYRNTEVFTLLAAPGTATVAVQADELGTGSNAGAGDIDGFVTAFVGVEVTNAATVLGTDRESDSAYRVRCRESTGILSPNGPRDAYSFLAKSATRAADGSSIGITRVRTIADGEGGVDVYVADADGVVTGDEDDPNTDLGAVAAAIWTQAEPLAVTARMHGATPLIVPVTASAWIRDTTGLTDEQIEELAEARARAFFGDQPIGGEVISPATGKVYAAAIQAVLADTLIDDVAPVIKLELAAPAADVDVADTEAPVLGDFALTVYRVNSRGVVT